MEGRKLPFSLCHRMVLPFCKFLKASNAILLFFPEICSNKIKSSKLIAMKVTESDNQKVQKQLQFRGRLVKETSAFQIPGNSQFFLFRYVPMISIVFASKISILIFNTVICQHSEKKSGLPICIFSAMEHGRTNKKLNI